jgi:predicted acyl esterase
MPGCVGTTNRQTLRCHKDQRRGITADFTARIYAATSARDTGGMLRLADVFPDGRALFLAEGVMRARHRDPKREGAFNAERLSAIEPDQPYDYSIDFWRPTGNRFARGHRIRIEISSSYYPFYLRNLNTGKTTWAWLQNRSSPGRPSFTTASIPRTSCCR